MRAERVLAHLARRLPDFEPLGAPVALEGGLLNHTWRVPGRPHPVIVKHAPDHIATAPEVPLDPSRLVFEARALADLSAGGRLLAVADDRARPPGPLDFDEAASVLVMEDLGELPDLARVIAREGDAAALGGRLGAFIGRLHGSTFEDSSIARDYKNLPIQQTRLAVQYRPVRDWLIAAGVDASRAKRIGARTIDLGERLLQSGRCLLMGDLWPPSILVSEDGLRLIDWEFAHFGSPVQDLAHLAAHLAMHGLCSGAGRDQHPWRGCWHAFVDHYRRVGARAAAWIDTPDAGRDLATHFAAEIFVRTIGPFAESYLFTAARERQRERALQRALGALEDETPSLEGLCPG